MPKSKLEKTAAKAPAATAPKTLGATGSVPTKKAGSSSAEPKVADLSDSPSKTAPLASNKKPASKTPSVVTPPVVEKSGPKKVIPRPELIPEQTPEIKGKPGVMTPWLAMQREKILELYDSIVDSMNGVAKDTLRSRAEGSEASAFGMHQADAGSDAYDRDFALSLLSQEQDALYEIEQALNRIQLGTYGICEMSGKEIMQIRLEAMPFARYTVECQAEIERQGKLHKSRMPVTSLFGLTDEESQEGEEEDHVPDSKE